MRKDFALCFNDGYVPFACVTIKSIADSMDKDDDVHIHIVSDHITERHQKILRNMAGSATVAFYFDDGSVFGGMPDYFYNWSIFAWYRLLLPEKLGDDIHRVLYLDCDIVVNDNLDTLFTMNLEGKSIAACSDIEIYAPQTYKRLEYDSKLGYISTGVLLMNLDKWRKESLASKMLEFAKDNHEKIKYPDQDAINWVCRNDKIILPPRYGVVLNYFREKKFMREFLPEMQGLIESPAIVHYAGYYPWNYPKDKHPHSSLWWRTFNRIGMFPRVRYDYFVSFVKYWIKIMLINLGVIKKGSEHYIRDLYYCHPRVRISDVYKTMKEQ